MQDLRDAFRALKATPIVTIVAVLSLALGIGANTAIFSILDSLMLRALPVEGSAAARDPERRRPATERVVDQSDLGADPRSPASCSTARSRGATTRFNLARRRRRRELVDGMWASGGLFDVLGVPADARPHVHRGGRSRAAAGRTARSRSSATASGSGASAARPTSIGRTLTVERVPFTIVGVTPPDFFGADVGRAFDVAIPIGTEPLIRGKESSLDRAIELVAERDGPPEARSVASTRATAALRGVQPQIREATMPQDWRPQDAGDISQGDVHAGSGGAPALGAAPALSSVR